GGRQVYTHVLVLTPEDMRTANWHPFALARDALARGTMRVRLGPAPELPRAQLARSYPARAVSDPEGLAEAVPFDRIQSWCDDVVAGRSVQVAYEGDRMRLFEALINLLPVQAVPLLSFTTSLRPSVVRPFRLGPAPL